MSVNDFPHSLESLCGEGTLFKLKSVAAWFEYNEVLDEKGEPKLNEKGEKITVKGEQLGFKYTVVDCDLVVKFTVKIRGGTAPIIENATVRKTKESIMVKFGESSASFYGDNLYSCSLSVEAESVAIVSPVALAPKPPPITPIKVNSN
jgi:hypothetical protein